MGLADPYMPDGTTTNYSVNSIQSTSQMMLTGDKGPAAVAQWTDTYWGLLDPEPAKRGRYFVIVYHMEKWVQALYPYALLPDPLRVTLFYDRVEIEDYNIEFQSGLRWSTVAYAVKTHICGGTGGSGDRGVD